MRIKKTDHSLLISDIPALNARTAPALVAQARASLPAGAKTIDVDLSQTDSVDSHGLGALVGFYRSLHQRNGSAIAFRLHNPAPPAQQLIELTRLHHLFEIVHDAPVGSPIAPPLS
ncbi:MAG: hypothetical protein C0518_02090 [Opitutus sp.]|nr:hypothetical protein [Opitutus sp.]